MRTGGRETSGSEDEASSPRTAFRRGPSSHRRHLGGDLFDDASDGPRVPRLSGRDSGGRAALGLAAGIGARSVGGLFFAVSVLLEVSRIIGL